MAGQYDLLSPQSKTLSVEETELNSLNDAPTRDLNTTHHHHHHHHHPWLQTFLRWGPLLGISALALSFISIIVALLILVVSHGEPVSSWRIQPSVYLSITTAASNMLIRFALTEALPVSWWLHALRGGTIKALEQEWASGRSLRHALTSGHLGIAALACVAATLLVMDGPLLQHASTVVTALPPKAFEMAINVSPQLPYGFSGLMESDGVYILSDAANTTFAAWLQNEPIKTNVTGCDGTCTGKIHAPGLVPYPACATSTIKLDGFDLARWPQYTRGEYLLFNSYLESTFVNATPWYGPNQTRASATPVKRPTDRESVLLYSGWTTLLNGLGNSTYSQCFLVPATLEYDVIVSGNGTEISLDSSSPNSASWPLVALANNSLSVNAPSDYVPSTIAPLYSAAAPIFDATYFFTLPYGSTSSSANITSAINGIDELNEFGLQHITTNSKAGTYFVSRDPRADILSMLNALMFRAGVYAATNTTIAATLHPPALDPGVTVAQTINGTRTDHVSVFRSDLRWWGGASALQIWAVLLVAPLFWGWWRLGRDVSFSPFEIAKAFDAPVLRAANSNAGAKGIVGQVGGLRTRYGVASAADGTMEGATRSPPELDKDGFVPAPAHSTAYDPAPSNPAVALASDRLVFSSHAHVGIPARGTPFGA